ncbi:carbohydrate-binding protein [Streptomyces sp900129855]|uniref:Carbohydrate-binding protein n=1 Tax=Streptomyces sp. 900129855 TaxID=3155129 RepID=A0ABV2ZWC7_9ACTN
MRTPRRIRTKSLAAVATAAAALIATSSLNPALAASTPSNADAPAATTAGIARPVGDDPASRGAVAPIAGVVPGLTGPAARKAAGAAANRFRQLADERTRTTVRPAAHPRAGLDAQLHANWGITMPNGASQGLQADQSVIPGAQPTSGDDYVYAPTAMPASGACIEMTTAYTPDGPLLWAWDWCGGRDGVGKVTRMDSAFLATYTTTVHGRPAYRLDEHRTSARTNTWTAYLFNYRTHTWDTFFTSSGSNDIPQYPFGWDMFEIYTSVNPSTGVGYYCRDMSGQTFESSSIQLLTGSTWTPATAGNSTPDSDPPPPGGDFDCPSLTFALNHPNDDWTARVG